MEQAITWAVTVLFWSSCTAGSLIAAIHLGIAIADFMERMASGR